MGGKKVIDLWKLNRADSAEKAALVALLKNSAYRVSGKDPLGNSKSPHLFFCHCVFNA